MNTNDNKVLADAELLQDYQAYADQILIYSETLASNDPLRQYLALVTEEPALTDKETEILWSSGLPQVEIHLLDSTLRYAVAGALRYRHYGTSMLDLIMRGNDALLKAMKSYRPGTDAPFTIYAIQKIEDALLQETASTRRRAAAKIPADRREEIRKRLAEFRKKELLLLSTAAAKIGPVRIGEVVLVNVSKEYEPMFFSGIGNFWKQRVDTFPPIVIEALVEHYDSGNSLQWSSGEVILIPDADLFGDTLHQQKWLTDVIRANLDKKGFVLTGTEAFSALPILQKSLKDYIRMVEL